MRQDFLFSDKAYNLSGYDNVFEYSGRSEDLVGGLAKDGVHKIKISSSEQIDFLSKGFDNFSNSARFILVAFSGAVSKRENKKAPFFSGVGISETLNMPLLSISDPSLSLSPDLALAWYSGHGGFSDLPKHIADILDKVSEKYNAKILMIGGSGGGFAALNVGTLMSSKPSVFIWGPQTSISSYSSPIVKNYIEKAFGKKLHGKQGRSSLYNVLTSLKVRHDLTGCALDSLGSLVYLQNVSDSHTIKHAGPFLQGRRLSEVFDGAFAIDSDHEKVIAFCDWGYGHIPPPKSLITNIARSIIDAVGFSRLSDLYSLLGPFVSGAKVLVLDIRSDDFNFECFYKDGSVVGALIFNQDLVQFFRFSFYLTCADVILSKVGYSSDYSFSFSVKDFEGNFRNSSKLCVVAYIKDAAGNIFKVKDAVEVPIGPASSI